MKQPITIESAESIITDRWPDAHIARRHAYLSLGGKLVRSIASKAFLEPIIMRADWIESRDMITSDFRIRCRIRSISFKDWAIENLRAGQEDEWGKILEIPLTNERMMLYRDSFLYTK